ncbi:MAG: hypothetical protein ACFE9R_13700 [Candidatus Hermodarchaeota archaeon]
MAIVNRHVYVNDNMLSRAAKKAMYNCKYFENTEKVLKNIKLQRERDKSYF